MKFVQPERRPPGRHRAPFMDPMHESDFVEANLPTLTGFEPAFQLVSQFPGSQTLEF